MRERDVTRHVVRIDSLILVEFVILGDFAGRGYWKNIVLMLIFFNHLNIYTGLSTYGIAQ